MLTLWKFLIFYFLQKQKRAEKNPLHIVLMFLYFFVRMVSMFLFFCMGVLVVLL